MVQVACGVGERGLNVSQAGRYAAGQVGDTVDSGRQPINNRACLIGDVTHRCGQIVELRLQRALIIVRGLRN